MFFWTMQHKCTLTANICHCAMMLELPLFNLT